MIRQLAAVIEKGEAVAARVNVQPANKVDVPASGGRLSKQRQIVELTRRLRKRACLWLAGVALVLGAQLLTDHLLWEPGLTEDNVRRIKPGMTLVEVTALLGGAVVGDFSGDGNQDISVTSSWAIHVGGRKPAEKGGAELP
jgi:hypothetical protein